MLVVHFVCCQNDNEKESDAASLSVDLGFPDEDDEQQHTGLCSGIGTGNPRPRCSQLPLMSQ